MRFTKHERPPKEREGGEGWKIETGRLVTLPRFRELINKMIKLFEFSLLFRRK